jgi:hypothetical protein
VQAAYVGPDDLLDALWWLEHPLEPGPSGARPPAADAAEARRALYGRSAPHDALQRYRAAADREAETRAAIASALAAVDGERPPLRRLVADAPSSPPGAHSRRVAPKGQWRDVFLRARGSPRTAPLVRLPRATVYAVETDPPTACLFLITDLGDFQGQTVEVEEFERAGATLEIEPPLDGSIGLVRVQWLPGGEVRWETRPVERVPGPF